MLIHLLIAVLQKFESFSELKMATKKQIASGSGEHLFTFARALKSKAKAEGKLENHNPYIDLVREWHKTYRPKGNLRSTLRQFVFLWHEKIDFLQDEPITESLFRKAKKIKTPPCVENHFHGEPILCQLGTFCRVMQDNSLDGFFYISSEVLGKKYEVAPTQAWRWLRRLESKGIIKCLARGGKGRCNHYRFLCKSDCASECNFRRK